jgi:hypothetical protein
LSEALSPGLKLAQHLGPRTTFALDEAGTKTVLLHYFVFRQQELKVPRRIRRLLLLADASLWSPSTAVGSTTWKVSRAMLAPESRRGPVYVSREV